MKTSFLKRLYLIIFHYSAKLFMTSPMEYTNILRLMQIDDVREVNEKEDEERIKKEKKMKSRIQNALGNKGA